MDRSGRVLGTIARLWAQGEFADIRPTLRGRPAHIQARLPIESNTLWALAPDGSAVVLVHRPIPESASEGGFRIEKVRPTSEVIFSRRYRFPPKTVPAASVDSLLQGYVNFWSRAITRADAERLARDSIPIPRFQAPITHLAVGRDGTIWLRREALGVPQVEWMVLDSGGEIIGHFAAPPSLLIYRAQRDMVWGIEKDELDVPYVVRYRVVQRR